MWCKTCAAVTPCEGVDPSQVTRRSRLTAGMFWREPGAKVSGSDQLYQNPEFPNLYYFVRGRVCTVCSSKTITGEVSLEWIDQLVSLRQIAGDANKHSKRLSGQTKRAQALLGDFEKLITKLAGLNSPTARPLE